MPAVSSRACASLQRSGIPLFPSPMPSPLRGRRPAGPTLQEARSGLAAARSADHAGTLDDASWLMPAAEILCGWLLTRWGQYDAFPRHPVDDATGKAVSSGSRWRSLLAT